MKPIIFDLETSQASDIHGPDFRGQKNDFYTVIYGSHPEKINTLHNDEGFKRQLPEAFSTELSSSDILVGHNLGFDLSYVFNSPEIQQFLLRGGTIWDTQVAEYLLTAQQHQFSSLSELQEKYLGEKKKIERISYLYSKGVGADKILAAKTRCSRVWEQYNKYCTLDGSTTLKIFKQQYLLAKKTNMLKIIQMYQDYLLSLVNMSCTGIELNMIETEKTLTEFNLKHIEYLEKAQLLISKMWSNPNLPKFNINSPDHKSAILFGGEIKNSIRTKVGQYKHGGDKYKNVECKIWVEGFGLSKYLTRQTKKDGVFVTDNAVMQQIERDTKNATVKQYCLLQKEAMMYKKAAKTYVEAFIKLSVNSKLFPNFNNVATTTGRLSSSKPNMQNISKRNKFGKLLHRLFVAPKGWKCCQVDFSQLEVWVLAWLSEDTLLRKHLAQGIDMHCVRLGYYNEKSYDELVTLCKVEQNEYWVKARSAAKTVSYQMAYGAMPPKVAESTGLPLDTVKLIYEKEAETYPKTIELGENVMKAIKSTATFSLGKNIPSSQKRGINGHKLHKNIELLPIFDNNGKVVYNKEEFRKIGYWTSPTGKKYHFLETGRIFKNRVGKNFSFTQPKNYPMQGTAADIQGASTSALLLYILKNSDKIKMINEVHDSKWFYIKEEYLDEVIVTIKDLIEDIPAIFNKRFGINVPFKFPVDVEIGDDFANMSNYNVKREESNEEDSKSQ